MPSEGEEFSSPSANSARGGQQPPAEAHQTGNAGAGTTPRSANSHAVTTSSSSGGAVGHHKSIAPLASTMLVNGFSFEEVIHLVEKHYQLQLEVISQQLEKKMVTEMDAQLVTMMYQSERKRRRELFDDVMNLTHRYSRAIGAGAYAPPPEASSEGASPVSPHRNQSLLIPTHANEGVPTPGPADGVAPSPLVGQLGQWKSHIAHYQAQEERSQREVSMASSVLAAFRSRRGTSSFTPGGSTVLGPMGSFSSVSGGSVSPASGGDGSGGGIIPHRAKKKERSESSRLAVENLRLGRELDTAKEELRQCYRTLHSSLRDRKRLSEQHTHLNRMCMQFQDEVSTMEEAMRRMKEHHWDVERKFEVKTSSMVANVDRLEIEMRAMEEQAEGEAAHTATVIRQLEEEIEDEKAAAAKREDELLHALEQSKHLLRVHFEGQGADAIERHLEPLRAALSEALTRADDAEERVRCLEVGGGGGGRGALGSSSPSPSARHYRAGEKQRQPTKLPALTLPPPQQDDGERNADIPPGPGTDEESNVDELLLRDNNGPGGTSTPLTTDGSLFDKRLPFPVQASSSSPPKSCSPTNNKKPPAERAIYHHVSPSYVLGGREGRDGRHRGRSDEEGPAHSSSSPLPLSLSPTKTKPQSKAKSSNKGAIDRDNSLFRFEKEMRRRRRDQQDITAVLFEPGTGNAKTIPPTWSRLLGHS